MLPLCIAGRGNQPWEQTMRYRNNLNTFNDVVDLVSSLLKADKDVIAFNLKKHPYPRNVPLMNIRNTVNYLMKRFNNEAIVKAAPIVLYPL